MHTIHNTIVKVLAAHDVYRNRTWMSAVLVMFAVVTLIITIVGMTAGANAGRIATLPVAIVSGLYLGKVLCDAMDRAAKE